ncbi:predicted protein [Plenodomus lingam JN3]|uniref:Predicted protein n=1 Tax=Leptosphaeria maculans (strain JN3 / isolate v23.1.3 / race Av1-4-5-6-7-8) TaxID=985895 RepID=E4ZY39_LEPMJ|nr:predicted protein [Plenodomus lingam JN3]CBX96284.1 predicted protein [Plenodomus lingam JN3]
MIAYMASLVALVMKSTYNTHAHASLYYEYHDPPQTTLCNLNKTKYHVPDWLAAVHPWDDNSGPDGIVSGLCLRPAAFPRIGRKPESTGNPLTQRLPGQLHPA